MIIKCVTMIHFVLQLLFLSQVFAYFDQLPYPISLVSKNYNIVDVTDEYLRLRNMHREEVVGRCLREYTTNYYMANDIYDNLIEAIQWVDQHGTLK